MKLFLRVFKICISCLRVVCSRFVFGEVTSPNTRTSEAYCCKLTGRFWSLYGGDKRVTPRQQAVIEGRGSSTFYSNPKACIEAELRIFLNPRAQEETPAWNFPKYQGPYKEGEFGIFPSLRDYVKAVLGIGFKSHVPSPYRIIRLWHSAFSRFVTVPGFYGKLWRSSSPSAIRTRFREQFSIKYFCK